MAQNDPADRRRSIPPISMAGNSLDAMDHPNSRPDTPLFYKCEFVVSRGFNDAQDERYAWGAAGIAQRSWSYFQEVFLKVNPFNMYKASL